MKKIALLALAGLLAVTGCAATTTQPDEVGLHHDGGPLTGTDFKGCIEPGSKKWANFADHLYKYPRGQRTWDFTGGSGEAEPIPVTDANGVTLNVPGIVTWTLNIGTYTEDGDYDCAALREFHERIGLKYEAWTDSGWDQLLEAYLGNPISKAMDQASQKYPWRDLLLDEEVRRDWELEVGRLARSYVLTQAGGDFFCAPTFTGENDCGDFALTLQKPLLPESITTALNETEAEKEKENQARSIQKRINVEAETLQALVDVLGPEAAVLYQAIQNGQVSVIPLPAGANVNLNAE